jgi:uncharacterized integral membrane protein (TIGR00698 family)
VKLRVKGIGFGTVIRCSVSGRNAHASHMLFRWRMLVFFGSANGGKCFSYMNFESVWEFVRLKSLGISLALTAAVVSFAAASQNDKISPVTISLVLGVLAANTNLLSQGSKPGIDFAARKLLRVGIILLGFRLALGDLQKIGSIKGLLAVALVVVVAFVGIALLGRAMKLSGSLSLLVATGYSICGVSAIAAVRPLTAADEEEVAYAIGLVTLFGSLSMLVYPIIGDPILSLSAEQFGWWTGAAVHDVAQVVATSSSNGDLALEVAVVVKLARVVLLAPLVLAISLCQRGSVNSEITKRPPIVPVFVILFVAAVVLRSANLLPSTLIDVINSLRSWLFTMAMFAVGSSVRLKSMFAMGGRPLVLGAVAWIGLASFALLIARVVV